MNKFERYFNGVAHSVVDDEVIRFSGYFKEYLGNVRDASLFMKAVSLKGYFLAITDNFLIVVETRASGTNKPLMENNNCYATVLSKLNVLSVHSDKIHIQLDAGPEICLEVFASNRYLSRQMKFIEHLHSISRSSVPLKEIIRASKVKHLTEKLVLYFILSIPLLLVAFFVFHEMI